MGLLRVEAAGVNGFVLGIQGFIGTQAGPKLGDPRQFCVVGGSQIRRVHHGLQMADHAPSAAKSLGCGVKNFGNRRPISRKVVGSDLRQCCIGLGQQAVNGGSYRGGLNLIKQGEVREVEQGMGHE